MKKRVLLWLTVSNTVGRDVFRGVYQYTRLHAPDWEIQHAERLQNDLNTALSWEFDGLIGPFNTQSTADAAEAAYYPFCVNLHGSQPFNRLPQVGTSDYAIGVMAANYFLNRHFNHFCYLGYPGLRLSDERWNGYFETLARQGKTADQLSSPDMDWSQGAPKGYWEWVASALPGWITQQPRPLALFMDCDARSESIYKICKDRHLKIPDDIALLGVNDEDIFCHNKIPPLSSIRVPSRMAGYRAAQILDHLFKTGKPPARPLFLEPETVVERGSTALFSVSDPQLAKALQFITENAARKISVSQIAAAAGLSRRVLEKRFRIHLNSSPLAEKQRAQIEMAKNTLRETDLSLEAVAEITGFSSGNYLSQLFKKTTGQPPGTYRRTYR